MDATPPSRLPFQVHGPSQGGRERPPPPLFRRAHQCALEPLTLYNLPTGAVQLINQQCNDQVDTPFIYCPKHPLVDGRGNFLDTPVRLRRSSPTNAPTIASRRARCELRHRRRWRWWCVQSFVKPLFSKGLIRMWRAKLIEERDQALVQMRFPAPSSPPPLPNSSPPLLAPAVRGFPHTRRFFISWAEETLRGLADAKHTRLASVWTPSTLAATHRRAAL